MIPLRDINYTRSRPVVTYLLIGLNAAVFLYEVQLHSIPGAFEEFVLRWGFVPYFFTQDPQFHSLSTPLTSMFMHGDLTHLLFNMWFLHIFGDNVEDSLGRTRFAFYYLACGLLAALGQLVVDPSSRAPMVGASGAIAGVLGGYFRLFPRARVVTFMIFFFEIPAVVFIVIWFGLQLWSGFGSLLMPRHHGGGVAVFAHIGGFLAGVSLLRHFLPKRAASAGFKRPIARRRYESWLDE